MQLTPSVTFRGIRRSEALEADIIDRIKKLETYYQNILGCRVLVELGERHHESGNQFHVRIDISVPGETIVVNQQASPRAAAEDVEGEQLTKRIEVGPERRYAAVAVRQAFGAARRRLQDYARRQRGAVKTPARSPVGRVSRLFPVDEYGYIRASDGHEVYFQKSSVLNDVFDQLTVGDAVAFAEEAGDEGPQASTVRLRRVGKARRGSRSVAHPAGS
jgi:cold shock CspA family protein/ribosome-associated translation inhibitor RaiA